MQSRATSTKLIVTDTHNSVAMSVYVSIVYSFHPLSVASRRNTKPIKTSIAIIAIRSCGFMLLPP